MAKAGATTHLIFDVTGYYTPSGSGSRFHALTPTRVLDSRSNVGLNGVFHANTARTFTVADGTPIPTDAVAVTGNLTVTGQTKGGYVVLAPAAGGSTSTLNFPAGDTRGQRGDRRAREPAARSVPRTRPRPGPRPTSSST